MNCAMCDIDLLTFVPWLFFFDICQSVIQGEVTHSFMTLLCWFLTVAQVNRPGFAPLVAFISVHCCWGRSAQG